MKEIELYAYSNILNIIVNKCDFEKRRKFFEKRNDFSKKIKVPFTETSEKIEQTSKMFFRW
jgi:hypothetical protein